MIPVRFDPNDPSVVAVDFETPAQEQEVASSGNPYRDRFTRSPEPGIALLPPPAEPRLYLGTADSGADAQALYEHNFVLLGGSAVGGVNGGTIRFEGVTGLTVRLVAFGSQGAFGEPEDINQFAPADVCDPEPDTNNVFVDVGAGTSNHLNVLDGGDQAVTYQDGVGPANDKRRARRDREDGWADLDDDESSPIAAPTPVERPTPTQPDYSDTL